MDFMSLYATYKAVHHLDFYLNNAIILKKILCLSLFTPKSG